MGRKDEDGAIVVEATLSLTAFMFAVLMFLLVIDICYAQAKIGTALNCTAKEISQYSYLYSLTNLNQKQQEAYDEGAKSEASIDKTLEGVSVVTSTIEGVEEDYASYDFNGMVTKIQNCGGNLSDIYKSEEFQYIVKEPKNFIIGCLSSGFASLGEEVKSWITQVLTRAFIQKNLCGYEDESAENFLGRLQVEPKDGSYLDGLDFKGSIFYKSVEKDGKDEITDEVKLVVRYKVNVVKFLNVDFGFNFMQTAVTKVWGNGVSLKE